MQLESFVVSVSELLKLNRNADPNFEQTRKGLIIPKYQREYKWDSERVLTLFSDIKTRDKFLGNIILNKVSDYYEIVDGQQRIMTIILFMIALFNRNKMRTGAGLSEEQRIILGYLKRNGQPVLENESVGEYFREDNNSIHLDIDNSNDIYYQKNTFIERYREIEAKMEDIDDILDLQRKILGSQFLVLIGEQGIGQISSIEEVFLDINFKSQLLDVSSIFKGYCFKNYFTENHEELKRQWAAIRKCTKDFEKFGYRDNKKTSEFLYHYLLSRPESYDITENLSPRGKHYLEGKNNTETKVILEEMGAYGQHVLSFYDNLLMENYFFEDICADAKRYKTEIATNGILRQLSQKIMLHPTVQYYKFPFFMLIHYLYSNHSLRDGITFDEFKKLITNFFVYAFLFVNVSSRGKVKSSIDHTIFEELYCHGKNARDVITGLLKSVKNLRNSYLSNYKQFEKFGIENAYALYSLIDNYDSASNSMKCYYSLPDFNKEHLLIHENVKMSVSWFDEGSEFTFSLKPLLGRSDSTNHTGADYRKVMANYLILPESLNSAIKTFDIVTKIAKIKEYYQRLRKPVPQHIDVFFTHIEQMDEYNELMHLKGKNETESHIIERYHSFICRYFSEEQNRILYGSLENALKQAFRNQGN